MSERCGDVRKVFKRFFDFIFSLIAVVVLSPVLLALIIVGAVAMRGNPFFVQPRPGKKARTGRRRSSSSSNSERWITEKIRMEIFCRMM